MIKIVFPPGCYGNYLTRCLYYYTDLLPGVIPVFDFDHNGSSHSRRIDWESRKIIHCYHLNDVDVLDTDSVITIIPNSNHRLDYCNNQFVKEENSLLTNYIKTLITDLEIQNTLYTKWNWKGPIDQTVPKWMLREWLSFWIEESWNDGYNPVPYQDMQSVATLYCNDIFDNFLDTLQQIVQALQLTLKQNYSTIIDNHNLFVSKQMFHGSQIICNQWVSDVVKGINQTIRKLTIFDEAYLQSQFRKLGYEIKCHELDIFPNNSLEMKQLIFKL
jgi:hypothetical protein